MTDKKARNLRLAYKIYISVLTIVVAALFIMQACRIYFGAGEYSRGLVITYLKQISIPFFLWIASIVIGWIMWEILPAEGKKKYGNDVRYSLYRLKKKLPVKAEDDLLADAAEVAKQDKILRIVWGVCALACVALAAAGLAYLLDFSHFPAESSETLIPEMVSAVINVLPYIICAFALCIGASIYSGYNAKKQLPHLKRLAAMGKAASPEYNKLEQTYYKAVAAVQSDIFIWTIRAILLVLGIIFIILGVSNGGAQSVLSKATAICYECIGLG